MFETVFNAVLWGGVYNAYLALSDTYTRIQSELSEVPGRVIGEGHGNPLVFLPGVSHGQRSLVGYSPQGHRVGRNWSDLAFTQREGLLPKRSPPQYFFTVDLDLLYGYAVLLVLIRTFNYTVINEYCLVKSMLKQNFEASYSLNPIPLPPKHYPLPLPSQPWSGVPSG